MSNVAFDMNLDAAIERLVDDGIEQSFVGILLMEPKEIESVAWFDAAFFGREIHGKLFQAVKDFRAAGKAYSVEFLSQYFEHDAAFVHVGGCAAYLNSILREIITTVGTIKGQAHYLLSLHYRRTALAASQDMRELAVNPDMHIPPEKILLAVEEIITKARNVKTNDNTISAGDSARIALEMARRAEYGVNSGFSALHKITQGFKPGDLITIGARPGMGKSAMGLTLAYNAADVGKNILFFSLEMTHPQLMQRLISRLSNQAVHSGDIHDEDMADQAVSKLSKLPLHIDDSSGLTAFEIASRASLHKRRHGLDMIVVDYLGFIRSSDPKANKVHQVGEVTQAMKEMAKTLQVPVILLCQLSRASEDSTDKRPELRHLRDSGSIEQDSDMVLFIYREEYYQKKTDDRYISPEKDAARKNDAAATKGKAEIIVAKNRQGILKTIDLKFNGEHQVFYE